MAQGAVRSHLTEVGPVIGYLVKKHKPLKEGLKKSYRGRSFYSIWLILNMIPSDFNIPLVGILVSALWPSNYILWRKLLPTWSCGTDSQAHVLHCLLFGGELPILDYKSREIKDYIQMCVLVWEHSVYQRAKAQWMYLNKWGSSCSPRSCPTSC